MWMKVREGTTMSEPYVANIPLNHIRLLEKPNLDEQGYRFSLMDDKRTFFYVSEEEGSKINHYLCSMEGV